jgi:biopolymer transport protein ExbB
MLRRFSPALTPLVLGLLSLAVLLVLPSLGLAQEEGAAAPAASSGPSDNKMVFIIQSVGWLFGAILLGCSVWLVAIVVLLFLDLKITAAIPPGFVDEFTDIVNKRKFKEAYDMARNDTSFLGQVLTSGMARLQYGLEDAREAAHQKLESIKADKDAKNNYTAVIASLGPMLGLVGTVFGMIGAFMELGRPGSTANPTKLAENVAHALSVTLIGIAISVPAISFNAFFRNRINKLTMDVGHIADDLLTQMYHNSKKPAPPGGAPAAPGAPPGQSSMAAPAAGS